MTDVIPAETATTIENDANEVINAVKLIDPTGEAKAAAWYQRYAKGVIVTLGVIATAALYIIPTTDVTLYHYAAIFAGALTIVGVIEKANAPAK